MTNTEEVPSVEPVLPDIVEPAEDRDLVVVLRIKSDGQMFPLTNIRETDPHVLREDMTKVRKACLAYAEALAEFLMRNANE